MLTRLGRERFTHLAMEGEVYSPSKGGRCNVKVADEIMLISIISLIFIFAHAPVLSNLIYTKHAAVTLTGKRPPNRDPEWQRTELVQDTKALMVQDTKRVVYSLS